MEFTQEQADELIFNIALAAMYHNDDFEVLDESSSLHAFVSAALKAVEDVAMSEDERDALRVICGRAIVDPTAWRLEFIDAVLGATPDVE